MEELSIKEKAKAYDEALDRAKKWYNAPNIDKMPTYGNRIIEEIFPELIESEDERIRKEIYWFFTQPDTVCDKRWIAWLEKQGQTFTKEDTDNANKVEPKDYNGIDPHFGKPVDKVESKFKVGDWIIYDRHISKVKDMDSEGYLVEDTYGDEGILPKEFAEKHYHLWTIGEAKDGDVLADNVGVILFKSIGDNNVINFHAFFSGLFAVQEGEHYWGHIRECTLSPATKEQRERFFAAMNDAGWEFDFEKKELKKIPQRIISAEAKEAMYGKPTAWSEEDALRLEEVMCMIEANGRWVRSDDAVKLNLDWLKSLQQRIGE